MPQALPSLPLFLALFGAIWFLKSTNILSTTSILIVIDLTVIGITMMALDGINKQSVVSGPMLIYVGATIYLRTQCWVGFSPLVALGMMVSGCMLLLSRSSIVPYKQNKQVKMDDGK